MRAHPPDDGFWQCIARIHQSRQLYSECRTHLGRDDSQKVEHRFDNSRNEVPIAQFVVENRGQALENLSYTGVIENTTLQEFEGNVGKKETWNRTVIVTEGTKMISAELSYCGRQQ